MWALSTSNKYLEEHEQFKRRERHRSALKSAKGMMKIKEPQIPDFLNARPKQKLIADLRNKQIQHENTLLIRKLRRIEGKKGRLNPYIIDKKNFSPSLTHNGVLEKRFRTKVVEENEKMIERIQSAKTFYSNYRFSNDYRRLSDIKSNIQRNARRIRINKTEGSTKRKTLSKYAEARASYEILISNPTRFKKQDLQEDEDFSTYGTVRDARKLRRFESAHKSKRNLEGSLF